MRNLMVIVLVSLLAACASAVGRGGPEQGEQALRLGVVTRVEPVELEGDQQLGAGAIIGAAAGGILGHQIGSGSGQGLATVLGAVGGGLAGNAIQNRVERRAGQQVSVQLDDGGHLVITQPADAGLRVGDRVRVQGSGREARALRG